MSLFKKDPLKKLFEDFDREDGEDIFETAKLISGNTPGIVKAMELAVSDPVKYVKNNSERFSERGIELDDPDSFEELDADELLFLGMVDELEEHDFAFEFDYKCELEDFLWGLEQLKSYDLIADVIKTLKLDENEDIEAWGKEINAALDRAWGGDDLDNKAVLCYMDIDSDSYPLTIITYGTLGALPLPFIMAM